MNEDKTRLLKIKAIEPNGKDKYRIWASTKEVDGHDEIIDPNAFKNIADYVNKYPRILYNHSWVNWMASASETLPIGRTLSAEINEQGLIITFEFSPLELAQEVKELLDWDPRLLSASVGGFANTIVYDTKTEISTITDFHLLEVSLTAIPANEGCKLIQASLNNKLAKQDNLIKTIKDLSSKKYSVSSGSEHDTRRNKMLGLCDAWLKRKDK